MMADFPFSANEKNLAKIIPAIRHAANGADYDSGWLPSSGSKTVYHNLNVIPLHVVVMAADDPTGLDHQSDTYTACNRSSVTVAGSKAYYRVRINKGA